jgi:hypothetical protein
MLSFFLLIFQLLVCTVFFCGTVIGGFLFPFACPKFCFLGGFRAAGLASYEAYLERVKQYRRDQGAQTNFKIRFLKILIRIRVQHFRKGLDVEDSETQGVAFTEKNM